jgi:hypothetical protein
MRRSIAKLVVGVALISTVLAAGCSSGGGMPAKFVRYQRLQDGTRVAVVARLERGFPPGERAYVNIDDLKPGDIVIVRDVGRSWDEPQWKPSSEVVSRAAGQ